MHPSATPGEKVVVWVLQNLPSKRAWIRPYSSNSQNTFSSSKSVGQHCCNIISWLHWHLPPRRIHWQNPAFNHNTNTQSHPPKTTQANFITWSSMICFCLGLQLKKQALNNTRCSKHTAGSTRSTIATKLKYIQSIPILLSRNHKTKAPRKHPPTHKQRI